jgi:hypothetical protein
MNWRKVPSIGDLLTLWCGRLKIADIVLDVCLLPHFTLCFAHCGLSFMCIFKSL